MDANAVLEEVLKDEAFYRNSGGGITVSGGEALSQASFTADLLKACVREKLHTALDTSGYASRENLEQVIPFVDLLLWDIKHLDSRLHKEATGVGNGRILENLEKAAQSGGKIWLRMPLIAGFNDSPDHVRDLAALGKRMGVEKISLLPYHDGGSSKCRQMGRPYPFADGRRPDDEHVEKLKRMIEDEGLTVSVGN
jgi:pyruvate formate lyase activating enzyme